MLLTWHFSSLLLLSLSLCLREPLLTKKNVSCRLSTVHYLSLSLPIGKTLQKVETTEAMYGRNGYHRLCEMAFQTVLQREEGGGGISFSKNLTLNLIQ